MNHEEIMGLMDWLVRADRFRMGRSKIYLINGGSAPSREIFIESRQQMDDSYKWVVKMDSWVLGKDNKYYYEPIPSSRTDKFIAKTRFDNYREANEALVKHENGKPQVLTC